MCEWKQSASRWMQFATTIAAASLVAGCSNWMLAASDRKLLCRVAVDEKFDAPQVQPGAFSNPGGALAGAGAGAAAGALQGLMAGAAQGLFVAAPIGAIVFAPVGAIIGAECASAAAAHPTAEADLQRILDAGDLGTMKRALETALNAPRDECRDPEANSVAQESSPEGVVVIDELSIRLGCLRDKQTYVATVKWHAFAPSASRTLMQRSTNCTMESFRSVDEWFAQPDHAKAELEGVLAKTGKQIAAELLGESGWAPQCWLKSRENGEIVGGP